MTEALAVEVIATPSQRMQTAMVLFALEESLGDFVIQSVQDESLLPPSLRSEIERRVQGSGFVPVSQLVQETFIKEILDLAVSASKERSEHDSFLHLRKLMIELDIFDVRNSVCHPNRSFPPCFWFRIAAIASDPCIEKLRLPKVSEALRCALENRLVAPPEGWLQQRSWTVANNLPSTFDHQVTGLIARSAEAQEFRKRLRNLRNSLIAIVGPGGTGKTALCLEVLRESCQDPDTLKWADQVIYVSAKTERLTVRGVEPIADPLTSLESVKAALVQALYRLDDEYFGEDATFEDVINEMGDRKLLLCIDNLETLLREHPEEFDEFAAGLPRDWRILVTSRVSVNNANVLPIGPIRKDGAVKLARDYSSLRGAIKLPENQLERLAEATDRNPLAIRLAIDAYVAGNPLDESLAQTKDQITDFSYTTLVDHLSADAEKILETLFGANAAISRGQIGDLLAMSPDAVAEAMNSLLRTSLVTRELEAAGERYSLSSSVRELLLKAPRNTRVREEVYRRLREQEKIVAHLAATGSRDPFDESYIPPATPNHVKALIARVRPSVIGRASRADQAKALGEVRQAIEFDATQSALHRTEALLLEQLGDPYGALDALSRAVAVGAGDQCAQLKLAELLREEQRLEAAVEQTLPLVEAGYVSNAQTVSTRNRIRLFRTHYVSILWLKRYEPIMEISATWKDQGDMRPAFAALRVSAIQRMLDEPQSDDSVGPRISEMLSCLADSFRVDGYLPDVVHEAFRALDRVLRLKVRGLLSEKSDGLVSAFLDQHLPSMCGTSTEHALADEFVRNVVEAFRATGKKDNPLNSARWDDLVRTGDIEDQALAEVGYVSARIIKMFPSHSFAQALETTQNYFVHHSATDLNKQQFQALREGQLLMILPGEDSPSVGKAWLAKHAMLDS